MSGCCCPQCWSLAEFMADLTGKDYGLAPAPRGHAPEPLKLAESACDGSYTCGCPECSRSCRKRPAQRTKLPWEMAA